MIDENKLGRTETCNDAFGEWRRETPPILVLSHATADIDFEAAILPGGHNRGENGATLYWFDGVVNEWAEWYSDLPTAMVRLAALLKCAEGIGTFRDQPEGFTRWADNFFERTVTLSIVSPDGEALL